MSLGKGLMSFGTGFLGGLSDIAADKKAKDDEYQRLVTALEFRGKEKEQDFEFDQKKLDQAREKRKNGLMGLGFTEDYLDSFGQFALESDANATAWLAMNQEYYGTPFWHTTPVNYHRDKSLVGKTVQDIQLGMSNSNDNFDNKQVVNNTKKENNLTDNISDSQFTDTNVSGNSVSKKGGFSSPNFVGPELFFGKKQYKTGDPKTFIGEDGLKVTAFRVSQTPGEDDYGSIYYVHTQNGHMPIDSFYGNTAYFDTSSDVGKNISNKFYPTIELETPVRYHMSVGGDTYILHGTHTKTTDGRIKKEFNYVPYNFLQKFPQFNTAEYFESMPGVKDAPDAPGAGFMTQEDMKYYTIDVDKFRNALSTNGINFNLNQFDDQEDFKLAETIGGVKQPKEFTLIDKNRVITSDIIPATGLDFSQSQLTVNPVTGEIDTNLFSGENDQQFNAKIISIMSNDLIQSWKTNSISDELSTQLGFNNAALNANDASFSLIGSKFGVTISSIHNNVRSYYQDLIMNYSKEDFESWRNANGIAEGEVEQNKKSIDMFAFGELKEANTINDLFIINDTINQARAEAFEQSEAAAFGSLDGAEGDTQTGMDIVTGIIKETMSKDITNTQLFTDDLTQALGGDDSAAKLILGSDFVVSQLAALDPEELPEVAVKEVDEDQEQRKETLEALDVEDWLNQNSVDPIPAIPSEASEWKKTNASDPNVKNMAGGQGSLYDKDTGFQIFKSRDLPSGHVEPRPGGDSPNANAGRGDKITQNWDLLYSKTHNADGTPKTQE